MTLKLIMYQLNRNWVISILHIYVNNHELNLHKWCKSSLKLIEILCESFNFFSFSWLIYMNHVFNLKYFFWDQCFCKINHVLINNSSGNANQKLPHASVFDAMSTNKRSPSTSQNESNVPCGNKSVWLWILKMKWKDLTM